MRVKKRVTNLGWVVVTGGPGAGKTALLELVRHYFDSEVDFVDKILRAVEAIRSELPDCCRIHRIDTRDRGRKRRRSLRKRSAAMTANCQGQQP